jgi:hypothetical protein
MAQTQQSTHPFSTFYLCLEQSCEVCCRILYSLSVSAASSMEAPSIRVCMCMHTLLSSNPCRSNVLLIPVGKSLHTTSELLRSLQASGRYKSGGLRPASGGRCTAASQGELAVNLHRRLAALQVLLRIEQIRMRGEGATPLLPACLIHVASRCRRGPGVAQLCFVVVEVRLQAQC